MAPRGLVHPRVDAWLVGWLAVFVWVVGVVLRLTGSFPAGATLTGIFWIGAVIGAAHFGLTYHLAYRSGRVSIAAAPGPLLLAPLLIGSVLLVLVAVSLASGGHASRHVTAGLITSVYLLTTWHYIKQVYGVGRVGAAFAGVKLTPGDIKVLRYALYPLWFLGSAQVLVRGVSNGLAGYRVGYPLLPHASLTVLRLLALSCALPVAAVLYRLRRPPGVLVAPYVAAFLWLGLPINPAMTILALAPLHALQYLAIGHRAEIAIADGPVTSLWWLNIFAGAACGGLLLGRWVPQFLDRTIVGAGQPALFLAAFFVFLNLHHYLIDASIWRSRGQLVGAVVRVPAPRTEPAQRVGV